jgi:hypothetical protein
MVGLFEEETVILRLGEMAPEEMGQKVEHLTELVVRHAVNQDFHEGVVRKLLQIVDNGFFIGFPIKAVADHAVVGFDKAV